MTSAKEKLAGQLSARSIPGLLKRLGTHCDGRGLNLVVTDKGASWQFRYMLNGRARTMGLGSVADVSLAAAREAVAAARALKALGTDPIDARAADRAAKRAAPKPITFDEAARRYFERFRRQWRSQKHLQQWQAQMLGTTLAGKSVKTDHIRALRTLPIGDVDKDAIKAVLEPIWFVYPNTASRILERIRQVLDFAIADGLRAGPNPASHVVFKSLFPPKAKVRKVRHYPALPFEEAPEFISKLRATPGISARALEMTILCATRTQETLGARWGELDLGLAQAVWVIPRGRMKMDEDHRVPLSIQAVALLRALRPEDAAPNDLVFKSPHTKHGILGHEEMLRVIRRLGHAGLTVHGFRSTFSDWSFHKTDHSFMEVEISLAHKVGGNVHEAYRRRDLFERRAVLMARWANYLDQREATREAIPLALGA
jgi:integrase